MRKFSVRAVIRFKPGITAICAGLYVSLGQGAYGYGKYSFMGGRPDDTLILIDGVRLNNRLFGGIYLDTLPLIAIDRIEVLQGRRVSLSVLRRSAV